MSRCLFLLPVLVGLAACTAGVPSNEEVTASLQKVTASVIAAPDPLAIGIEEPERLAAKWEWRAVYAGKTYNCNADNLMRLPDCTPV